MVMVTTRDIMKESFWIKAKGAIRTTIIIIIIIIIIIRCSVYEQND